MVLESRSAVQYQWKPLRSLASLEEASRGWFSNTSCGPMEAGPPTVDSTCVLFSHVVSAHDGIFIYPENTMIHSR
jgi:hypothetical protein